VRLLINPIRNYAWGSRSVIASLQGRSTPTELPEAELWMGAHPAAPSYVDADGGPVALNRIIAADPGGELGESTLRRFDDRLPYLLKILAAARPLSLQVHPDAAQARAGFAAEDDAGVARDAVGRNYVDPYHKPELLVAIGEFEALCGFRDPDVSAAALDALSVPALAPVISALRAAAPVPERLRQATEVLTGWPESERADLVAAVRAAAIAVLDAPGDGEGRNDRGGAAGRETCVLVRQLADAYPSDVGVLIALLLNHVTLRPDEAVFVPAGTPHAYVRGAGVEVMAASDNVLRGGLTDKHVDVAEVTRITRYEVAADPVVRPEMIGASVVTWPVPVSEFALTKAVAAAADGTVVLPDGGPRIVVCTAGSARLEVDGAIRTVHSGESVFVSAAQPPVMVSGDAVVFQASTN
jgi:mannose-6-phosphate isomerase